jgi:hypothetical protein
VTWQNPEVLTEDDTVVREPWADDEEDPFSRPIGSATAAKPTAAIPKAASTSFALRLGMTRKTWI